MYWVGMGEQWVLLLGGKSGQYKAVTVRLMVQGQYHVHAYDYTYLIIVTDAADAVSVNFSGRCKFLQI